MQAYSFSKCSLTLQQLWDEKGTECRVGAVKAAPNAALQPFPR